MLVEKINKRIEGDNELDANIYLPEGNKKYPGLLISHGFLSGQQEFGDIPENLAKQGYVVVTYDFAGHGKSKGDRGYLRSSTHLNDAERALKLLLDQDKTDNDKVAVIGHSLGSVATIRLITESEIGKKVKLAVLLSPVRKLSDSISKLELYAYKLAYNISWPLLLITGKHIYMPYKFSAKDIFLSKDAIKKANDLKFLQKSMSINNYAYMITKIDNEKFAKKIDIPVLVGIAKDDKIVPNKGSETVYNAIKTKKEWFEIDNSGHSMMTDNNAKKLEDKIISWLAENI